MGDRADHTPGPWKQSCFLVTGADGSRVCHTGMGNLPPNRSPESEANARLIAAAPDLLAALKVASFCLASTTQDSLYDNAKATISAVISRATGEA